MEGSIPVRVHIDTDTVVARVRESVRLDAAIARSTRPANDSGQADE